MSGSTNWFTSSSSSSSSSSSGVGGSRVFGRKPSTVGTSIDFFGPPSTLVRTKSSSSASANDEDENPFTSRAGGNGSSGSSSSGSSSSSSSNSSSAATNGRSRQPSDRERLRTLSENNINTGLYDAPALSSSSSVVKPISKRKAKEEVPEIKNTRKRSESVPQSPLSAAQQHQQQQSQPQFPDASVLGRSTMRSSRKKLEMKDLFQSGDDADVAYLMQCLHGFSEGKGGIAAFAFVVALPPPAEHEFTEKDTKRLKAWLESMGFSEALHGNKLVHKLASDKTAELRRCVASVGTRGGGGGGVAQESLMMSFASSATPAQALRGGGKTSSDFDPPSRMRAVSAGDLGAHKPSASSSGRQHHSNLSINVEHAYKGKPGSQFALRSSVLAISEDNEESPRALLSPAHFSAMTGRETPLGGEDEDLENVFPQLGANLTTGLTNLALDQQLSNMEGFRPIMQQGEDGLVKNGTHSHSDNASIASDDSTDLDEEELIYDPDKHMRPLSPSRGGDALVAAEQEQPSDFSKFRSDSLVSMASIASAGSCETMQKGECSETESHPQTFENAHANSGVKPPLPTHSQLRPPEENHFRLSVGSGSMLVSSPFQLATSHMNRDSGIAAIGSSSSSGGGNSGSNLDQVPHIPANRESLEGGDFASNFMSMRSSGRESNSGSGFPARPFNRSGAGGERSKGTSLRRTNTMPTVLPSRTAVMPGAETPGGCGISMSQGDTGLFRTPQSLRVVKFSGGGENDWGVSLPANAKCLQNMLNRLEESDGAPRHPHLYRAFQELELDYFRSVSNRIRFRATAPQSASATKFAALGPAFQAPLQHTNENSERKLHRTNSMPSNFGYPAMHSTDFSLSSATKAAVSSAIGSESRGSRESVLRTFNAMGKPGMNSGGKPPIAAPHDGRAFSLAGTTEEDERLKELQIMDIQTTHPSFSHPLGVPLRKGTFMNVGVEPSLHESSDSLEGNSFPAEEAVSLARRQYMSALGRGNSASSPQTVSNPNALLSSMASSAFQPISSACGSSSDGVVDLSRQSREDRRKKQSNAKWRRMSVGFQPGGAVRRGSERMSLGSVDRMSLGVADCADNALDENKIGTIEEGDEGVSYPYPNDELPLFDTSMSPAVHAKRGFSPRRRRASGIFDPRNMSLAERSGLMAVNESNQEDSSSIDGGAKDMSVIGYDGTQADNCADSFHMSHPNENEHEGAARLSPHLHPNLEDLTERTFRAHIVGGTYQLGFDEYSPIVAAPTSTDRRILSAHLFENDGLELRIFSPISRVYHTVHLDRSWTYMRASPVGYIVFGDVLSLPMTHTVVGYYLPHHPVEWSQLAGDSLSSDYATSMTSVHMGASRPGYSFTGSGSGASSNGIMTNFSSGRSLASHSTDNFGSDDDLGQSEHGGHDEGEWAMGFGVEPGKVHSRRGHQAVASSSSSSQNSQHVKNAQARAPIHIHHNSVSITSAEQQRRTNEACTMSQSPEGETGLYMQQAGGASASDSESLFTVLPDWNKPSIVMFVLEYLLGESGGAHQKGMQAQQAVKPTRTSSRSRARTRSTDSQYEDINSYRLVSKAWCMGSFRLLARHLSSPLNCPHLPYAKWAKFVSRNGWGKYISSGACKNVYCVQNSKYGMLEAVSIMDVEDLSARGMEEAIARELEISLSCSALVTLRICPFLVQVHSLFRSECQAPETLWREKTTPPIILSANNSRSASGANSRHGSRDHLGDLTNKSALTATKSTGTMNALLNACDESLQRFVQVPKKNQVQNGCFQYIRMEFCAGGDLEEMVRKSKVPAYTTRVMLFQMCYALYACREQLQLRHYDVKLLNFFCTKGSAMLPEDLRVVMERRPNSPFESFRDKPEQMVELYVWLGHRAYCLPLRLSDRCLVKLADFGTSVVGYGGLGDRVTVQQFTTLENTPPEYLLLGSASRQSFAADTFSLGLSFLHLLTGYEPYEVLLADVRCPVYLCSQLEELWSPSDPEDQYYILREVVESLDFGEEAADDRGSYDGLLLCDTLYRYLVLFGTEGLSGSAEEESDLSPCAASRCWAVICEALGGVGGGGAGEGFDDRSSRDHCMMQYRRDSALWSVATGSTMVMIGVRDSLRELYHDSGHQSQGLTLLQKMVNWDPSKRCSMLEALCDPLFNPLLHFSSMAHGQPVEPDPRTGSGSPRFSRGKSPHGVSNSSHQVNCTHYFRGLEEGGVEVLPMV